MVQWLWTETKRTELVIWEKQTESQTRSYFVDGLLLIAIIHFGDWLSIEVALANLESVFAKPRSNRCQSSHSTDCRS